jgi:hypothetical protein
MLGWIRAMTDAPARSPAAERQAERHFIELVGALSGRASSASIASTGASVCSPSNHKAFVRA